MNNSELSGYRIVESLLGWERIESFVDIIENYDPTKFSKIAMDLLWYLAIYEKLQALKWVLLNKKFTQKMFLQKRRHGGNIFHEICFGRRSEDIISCFIESKYITPELFNARDQTNMTPFDYICRHHNHVEALSIIQKFIKSGKMTYETFLDNDGYVNLDKFTSIDMFNLILESNIIPSDVWNKIRRTCYRPECVLTRYAHCKIILLHLLKSGKITEQTINIVNGPNNAFINYALTISNNNTWLNELDKAVYAITNGMSNVDDLQPGTDFLDADGIIDLNKIPSIPVLDMLIETNIITDDMLNVVKVDDKLHTIITHNIGDPILLFHLLKMGKITNQTIEATAERNRSFIQYACFDEKNALWLNEILNCDAITNTFVRRNRFPLGAEVMYEKKCMHVVDNHEKQLVTSTSTENDLKNLRLKSRNLVKSTRFIKCDIEKLMKKYNIQ